MDRARRLNPFLQAFSYLPPSLVSDLETEPARELARLAVKDNIDVAGMPTACGSNVFAADIPDRSAPAVERLVEAGMAVIGKTSMPELAFGGWGTNQVCGTPRNPWVRDRHFVPGGSSSGSAVAVAAGLADVALGTDTGGSLRIPAALCGVVGLKPSFGRVSRTGVRLLSPSLDVVGPIARTVAGAEKALRLIAGADPEDPHTQGALPPLHLEGLEPSGIERTRLGIMPPDLLAESSPEVRRAYAAAVKQLQAKGAEAVPARPPQPWRDLVGALGTILGYEAAQLHAGLLAEADRMDPHVARRLRAGLAVTPQAYDAALKQRRQDQDRFDQWLAGLDVILTPATAIAAVPVEEVDEEQLPLSLFTRAINYLDWCAISIPCGLDETGLPLGLQIIAGRGREADLFRIGKAFEAVRGPFPSPDLGWTETPGPVSRP
jgi:aspartyl-tRNA(Asn)/glutamyl-tRNA(Gln) amidotransferase subunit A